jgi:hypothetical protein
VFAAVAADATVSFDQNTATGTITSPAFSTRSANELLLAFVATDSTGTANTTVKSVAGAGLNWVLVKRTNNEAGTSEIWRTFAPAILQNVTVTATLSDAEVSSMTVASYTGVPTTGTSGSGAIGAVASGYAASGAPSAHLVTTQSNSLVVGVGNDFDNAIARTVLAGQSLMHQDLSSTQDTYWVQRVSAPTVVKGTTVTLGDSTPVSDRFNLSICEILAAPAGPTLSLSASSISFGSVADGSSASLAVTLSSTGSSALQINSASVAGTGFSLVAETWPQTIASGQSLTLQIKFAPTVAAAESGTLTISSNSSSGTTSLVSLAGTGTAAPAPQLTLSAASLAFGSVQDAATKSMPVTLTSTGTSAVTVNSGAVSGTGFSVLNCSFP